MFLSKISFTYSLACLVPYLTTILPKIHSCKLQIQNTPARSFGYFIKITRFPTSDAGAGEPALLLNYNHNQFSQEFNGKSRPPKLTAPKEYKNFQKTLKLNVFGEEDTYPVDETI